jgi:hypothetical protein
MIALLPACSGGVLAVDRPDSPPGTAVLHLTTL